jgi:ketosteroid isomerase-like protein
MTVRQTETNPLAAVERLKAAIDDHDLHAMVSCFAPEYESTFPVHPDRAFQGNEQVRKNWSRIFSAVPDLKAEVVCTAVDGETVWAEWEWKGSRRDGEPFHHRGVTIQGVRDGRMTWARLYMEPVQVGSGVDEAIRGEFPPEERA